MRNIKLKLTGLTMGLLMAAACQSQVAVTSPGFDTDAYQRIVRRAGMTGGVLGVGDDRLAATPYPSSYAADMWLTLVARRAGMPTPGPTPTPAPTATPGPTPTPSPTPTPVPGTVTFAYVGATADAVGIMGTAAGYNPNGILDHQFTVTVTSAETRYVQSVTVTPIAGPGAGEWNTDDTANWHAKVYNGGVTTAAGAVTAGTAVSSASKVVSPANLGMVDGVSTYNLFVDGNGGGYAAGSQYVVTVAFTDGSSATGTATIPAPACTVGTVLPLIPTMSSASAPWGTVTRSGVYSGYEAWQAFDAAGTLWLSDMNTTNVWLGYEWSGGIAKTVTSYSIQFWNTGIPQRAPKDWTLQGWNGSAWVTVDTVTNQINWVGGETRTFAADTLGCYSKYQVVFTADNYGGANPISLISIGNMQLYGYGSGATLAPTAIPTPNPATVVYVNKPTTGTKTWVETTAGSSTGGRYDDFNGASLDMSKWTVNGALTTAMTGSALKLTGSGYIETTSPPLMSGYVEWRWRDMAITAAGEFWSGPMSMTYGGYQVFHQQSVGVFNSQSRTGPMTTYMGSSWPWYAVGSPYHTARVEWGPTGSRKYIDGALWFSTPTSYADAPLPFIFNLQSGANVIEIDWVDYNGLGGTGDPVTASGLYAGGSLEILDSVTSAVLASGPTDGSGNASVDVNSLSLPGTYKFLVKDGGGVTKFTSGDVSNVYGGDAYVLNTDPVTVTISGALGPVVNARISVGGVALAGTVTAAGALVTINPTNVGDLGATGAMVDLLDGGGAVLASSPLGTVYHGDSYAFAVY